MKRSSLIFSIGVVAVSLYAISATALAGDDDLPKGQLIERVITRSDPSQGYALFLPSSYTDGRKYPVIYCFDPGARGRLPVELFREAAEKYGYIVVGSNNSRNGPGVPLNDIIKALWEDTHNRFSIDDNRVYAAGFSGGARVALALGYSLKGRIAGVIACSGGAPHQGGGSEQPPSFVLFGSAGVEDFNNPEMQALSRLFDKFQIPNRLSIFEGGHEWMPARLSVEAVEWLEVQAMRAGLKEKDERLLAALYDKAAEKARADEAKPDPYQAYLSYKALTEDFRGLKPIEEFEKKVSELNATKEVRQALKREKDLEREQDRRYLAVHTLIESVRRSDNRSQAFSELKTAISDLKKVAKTDRPSIDQIIARRLIDLLFIESFEQGNALVFEKQYEEAILHFSIGTEIRPDNPRIFYHLARACALGKDTKKALGALESAAEKGFSDVEALNGKEFAALQNEDRFKEIAAAVRKNAVSSKQ